MPMPAPALSAAQKLDTPRHWARSATLADLIVLRLAAGGATRAEMARDLRPLTRPDLAPALWRAAADPLIAELIGAELALEARGRLKATPQGSARATVAIGAEVGDQTWLALRDGALTARALGGDTANKALLKALANPDHLRALVVQHAFGLGDGRPMSLAKLRSELAVRALERAFGNQIKSGLGATTGLAARPSRLLAGQLSKVPRDYGSDGRLVATLAAEYLATANAEAQTLRLALLRRHFLQALDAEITRHPADSPVTPGSSIPSRQSQPAAVANDVGRAGQHPLPAARPGLAGFIREVQLAAGRRAEGWPGNRKAFICHVWEEIKFHHPSWALSEIEFKAMLAEAHRTGGLVLANADLKDKKHIQEFEKSAIQYKNTVWHFLRVEEV